MDDSKIAVKIKGRITRFVGLKNIEKNPVISFSLALLNTLL
jgi:hypothetical protein